MRIAGMLLLVMSFAASAAAQHPSNVSLKFLGFTIHPQGDPTAYLQPYKFDKKARFVMNFGGVLAYERFIWQDIISVKGLQALFADCSAGLASATHVAIRGTFLRRPRHRLSMGFGPALIVREDWGRHPDYQSSGFMNEGYIKPIGKVQWKIFWYGIEFEYDWKISERLDISASLTPGVPMAVTIGGGIRYWFNRDFEEKLYLPKMKKKRLKD